MDPELAERLGARTLELVEIPSVSRDEEAVLRAVRGAMPWEPTLDGDAGLLYLSTTSEPPLVLLAGHVDTVPAGGCPAPTGGDGSIVGRGASDMKGGCAVMIELARGMVAGHVQPSLGVGFAFFGREELGWDESALLPMLDGSEVARAATLAIVMEPTANAIEIGCLGNLNAVVTVEGVAAHSARPWLGQNAIHRAIGALGAVAGRAVREVEVDGLTYREVANVTSIEGGTATNVVPSSASARVNVRYAPTRTPADAESELRELLETDGVRVEIASNAPAGPSALMNPLVQHLKQAGDLEVGPKQAWTPVAEFGQVGVDAVNFGPGDPRYAHRDDERVDVAALVRSHEVLQAFVEGPGG